MKYIISFSLLLVAIIIETPAQIKSYLGIGAGYGMLNMEDVNSNLKDTYDIFSPNGTIEEITGGMLFEMSVIFESNQFLFGASLNYISGEGEIIFPNVGNFKENYKVNTTEFLGIIGVRVPFSEITSLVLKGGAGYGLGSAEHFAGVSDYSVYGPPRVHEVSGGYFSGRLQGGFDFTLGAVIISVSAAYRIANSGQLKGEMNLNGIIIQDVGIRGAGEKNIEFDYSGIAFLSGIYIII